MTDFDAESYSEAELLAEFERLFPHGFASVDVLQEWRQPAGKRRPWRRCFTPRPRNSSRKRWQCIATCFHCGSRTMIVLCPRSRLWKSSPRSMLSAPWKRKGKSASWSACVCGTCFPTSMRWPRPTAAGSISVRSGEAAAFWPTFLNRQTGREQYDYLSFYLGTIWVAGRADLAPIYQMIFRRLRARGLDWVYHFPRLGVVDMRPLKEALEQNDKPEWTGYDPSEVLAREEAEREREKELAELRKSLDEGYREAVEQAAGEPPPATVRAYETVFGRFPRGWPPVP